MYEPKEFTSDKVIDHWKERKYGGWADPPYPDSIQFDTASRLTYNFETERYEPVEQLGICIEDSNSSQIGRPINKYSRTGVTGRGVLGKWGVNRTSYLLFFRFNSTGDKQVLLRLSNLNSWSMPGGFLLDSEASLECAKRCFLDVCFTSCAGDNSVAKDVGNLEQLKIWFEDATAQIDQDDIVSRGYIEDSRNTDNAWIEGTTFRVDLPDVVWSTTDPFDDIEKSCLSWLNYDDLVDPNSEIDIAKGHLRIIQEAGKYIYEPEYCGVLGFAFGIFFLVVIYAMNSENAYRNETAQDGLDYVLFNLDH